MAISRKLWIYSRALIPTLIGLCTGIALSLIFAPFLEEPCTEEFNHNSFERQLAENNLGYSSQIKKNLPEPPQINTNKKQPPRPKYAATELGIKEKLLAAVLTSSDTWDTFAPIFNKTFKQHPTKMIFFRRNMPHSNQRNVVTVKANTETEHVMAVLKYLADNYKDKYDWFYIVRDNTYVRGERLMFLAMHMSISYDIFMGIQQDRLCNFDYGILIAQTLFSKFVTNLDWCKSTVISLTPSEAIGQCILHSMPSITCTSTYNDLIYGIPPSNDTVTVPNLKTTNEMVEVHRYWLNIELDLTQKELTAVQDEMIRIAPLTPEGEAGLTWPIGVPAPSKAKNRFDIIRWDYFTETHIYFDTDFSTVRSLDGIDKQDIEEVILHSINKLKDEEPQLNYRGLENGYRRFDPARGMEYLLDIKLMATGGTEEEIRRVQLLRPLSIVELIPMAYVTEASKVNIILPVVAANHEGVIRFLDGYAKACLDSKDNSHLLMIFIFLEQSDENHFSVLKSMITFYESKYPKGARMSWLTLEKPQVLPGQDGFDLLLMDTASKNFADDSLVFFSSVGMELSTELLNRVRMNTILSEQVFFPIAFYEYKQNLIYDSRPYPDHIDILKNVGRFDENSFEISSFYLKDYKVARSIVSDMISVTDFFELFVKYGPEKLHVFRAVEPALRHHWRNLNCENRRQSKRYSNDTLSTPYERCMKSKLEGLANRQQLAMLLFQHEKQLASAKKTI